IVFAGTLLGCRLIGIEFVKFVGLFLPDRLRLALLTFRRLVGLHVGELERRPAILLWEFRARGLHVLLYLGLVFGFELRVFGRAFLRGALLLLDRAIEARIDLRALLLG